MARLTAKSVENFKAGASRREIPDAGSGLYFILQPSGHRSWAVRYRLNGKPVKLTLGKWPALSLHDARVAAAEALKQVRLGNDPAKAKADAKIKAMEAEANTVASICAAYMKREGGKLRTSDQRESILRRLVYPHIGDKPINSVKRSDIVAMLDRIEDHNGPRAADVTLAVLRRIMRWHATRDDEFTPVVVPGMNRQKPAEHRRTRILDDDEIRAVWAKTADKSTFSALIRFLLLTAARRNEAAAMKWDEISADGIWTLIPGRSKTRMEIARPLSKAARAILAELPRIDGCPFVFTTTGRTPISQFSIPKAKLDAASGVRAWRLHDLRRSARSLLSRAGVNSDVAEKCLGHSRGDIVERYDRHTFLPEMRAAFEKLATLVETIVHPPEGDVVIPMRKRRR
jgi:integrase